MQSIATLLEVEEAEEANNLVIAELLLLFSHELR